MTAEEAKYFLAVPNKIIQEAAFVAIGLGAHPENVKFAVERELAALAKDPALFDKSEIVVKKIT